MADSERRQVITLRTSIAKLAAVKHLLYGSNLIRIPPEIGAMPGGPEQRGAHGGLAGECSALHSMGNVSRTRAAVAGHGSEWA
ncbi:hypothetical protein [Streptomyces echinatus]|uniref:hypothetical protein n=1 Tax=Streptomyces echinatus TaxID=67293 RepID=UPI00378C1318